MIGGLLGSIGKMGGKSLAGFGKAAKIGGKFFGAIGKTFVKGKKGIKIATEMFKEIRKVAQGPMQGIFQLIEAFGILDPLFRVFAAIIKMFTAGFLIKMMPLFIRFVAIVTDPEYMRYVMALGAFFANTMIPALERVLWVMEAAQPFFGQWADMWEMWSNNEGSFDLTIRRFGDFFELIGQSYNALTAANGPLREFGLTVYAIARWAIDTRAALTNLMTLGVGGGTSGTGGGKGSKQSLGGAVKKLFSGDYAEGTPFVPRTGIYKLERGESVNTISETMAKATQMEDLLLMQEGTLSVQKDILHYMKYGV